MVEVTFTVSPRVRKIAAHDPDTLPLHEYVRQIFWGSGVDLPEDFERMIDEIMLDAVELPPGERAILSLQLPAEFVIVFEPVTHAAQFIDVKGEPTRERQSLSLVINETHPQNQTLDMRPGPLAHLAREPHQRRVLPAVWVAGDELHDLLERRRPFLTAKRLLTNQTFRDLYRTDTLDIDQRLKITSLTFLFTDLKGSTRALRARRRPRRLRSRAGAFPRPARDRRRRGRRRRQDHRRRGDGDLPDAGPCDRGGAADARGDAHLNDERGSEDLLLKIGIHEGPASP